MSILKRKKKTDTTLLYWALISLGCCSRFPTLHKPVVPSVCCDCQIILQKKRRKKKSFLMLCKRWILGLWNSLYPLAVTWHSACQYLWFIRVFFELWDASNIKQMLFVSVYDTICFCFLLIGDWQLACYHLHCVFLKTLQWRKRHPAAVKSTGITALSDLEMSATVVEIVHLNISGANSF